jgi:DNA-binding LacI/PurR family transcriptional regulator
MGEREGRRAGGGRPGGGVTLQDLARSLGVSKATVSNAYNRPDQLSDRLRERILAEARRLGYAGPDPIAATFSRRRAGAIGLIFDDPLTFALTDPAQVLFVTGIGEVCERTGVGLLLIPRGDTEDLVRRALVDGFVCHCDLDGDDRVDIALARRLPVVIVDGVQRGGAAHIGIDDRAGAVLAARHLVELGHRRIAVLAAALHPDGYNGLADLARQRSARYHVTKQRLAGYRDELERAGVEWPDVVVAECAPYGRPAAYHNARALLEQENRPTGLLAISDEYALGALRAADELGIDVPQQLSIVGFDDAPPAAWSSPGLTTVRQPHQDKGRAAAERLLGSPRPADDVEFPVELVVRGSTARPHPTS